jgi:proteasome lid subunit RPN8/RPN11
MFQLDLDSIQEAACETYPKELCGVVTKDKHFMTLTNISPTPEEAFVFDPLEWLKVKDTVSVIVHTHTYKFDKRYMYDIRSPSSQDYRMFKKLGIPWVIFACDGTILSSPVWLPRIPSNKYFDRPFLWYINDCYTLVQDYYRFELGIHLEDHSTNFDYNNRTIFNNLFDEYILSYGFTEFYSMGNLHNGDLVLTDHRGIRSGHLGIYHNGEILHQDVVSRCVPLAYYENHIHKLLCYTGDKVC